MRGWGPYSVTLTLKCVWRGVYLLGAAEKTLHADK